MRCSGISVVVGLLLSLASTLRAQDDREARAIIDKAIKAAGGAEAIQKLRAQTWEEKGKFYGMGDAIEYTGKYAVKYPDKYRMEIVGFMTIVLNGDKAWENTMGAVQELLAERLAEQQHNQYSGWVATLLPLQDKPFRLSVIGDVVVGDQKAAGIKVSHEGKRDVKLFFSKESGLLIKVETMTKAQELGGKEVLQETVIKKHELIDGVRQPVKIELTLDGKRYVEAEMVNIESKPDLADSVFGKP